MPWLLLLQSGNWAYRKLDATAYDAVLHACARADRTALWEVVDGDWDTYRVWTAIRALGAIGDAADLDRLIALGRTRILDIHWDAIVDAARARHRKIPAAIAAAQRALATERGDGDFHDDFRARRATWPAHRDVGTAPSTTAPRAAAPAARRPAKKAVRPRFPPVFAPVRADNAFVAAYKRSLARRLSLTRMEALFDEVSLAVFLDALGRADEALAIVSFLSSQVTFTGDQNIWTPVGLGICVEARLRRQAGDLAGADRALDRLRAHPFRVRESRADVRARIAELTAELDGELAGPSRRAACDSAARTLATLIFYRETVAAGFPHARFYPPRQVEAVVTDRLARLRERLDRPGVR